MSYSIRYGQDAKQETGLKNRKNIKWFGSLCACALIAAGLLIPQVKTMAYGILFPWINEATVTAFDGMVQSIGDGTAVPAAFLDFCREIIDNARIPV